MKTPLYLIYGICVLGFATLAQYSGWTLNSPNEKMAPPRTIRDNPGAYGPIYGGSPRYSGGK